MWNFGSCLFCYELHRLRWWPSELKLQLGFENVFFNPLLDDAVVYGIDDDWCSLDKSQNHLFVNPSFWYSPDSSAFLLFFCFGESGGDRSLYTSKKGNTSADIIRPEKQISAPWPLFKKELSSVLRLEILRTVPVLSYPAWNINIKYKRHLSHKCCIWKVGFCYY